MQNNREVRDVLATINPPGFIVILLSMMDGVEVDGEVSEDSVGSVLGTLHSDSSQHRTQHLSFSLNIIEGTISVAMSQLKSSHI